MLEGLYFGATFLLSVSLALYLTPIIRSGALAFGVVDKPDGQLKRQTAPVPYLGGIAVYLAFLIALSVVFDFKPQLLALLLGGTMLTMLGLFDDLRVLAPRLKLVGQLLVVWVLLRTDITIQLVALPAAAVIPLTVLWLIGITNAVNIIDVSDGLAASVSAIAALALFIIAVLNGDLLIATTTLALVGSLVGFLRYNQVPARIYLGDAGSLFIGFMLAALALIGAYTRRNEVAALTPIAILLVPILDTTLVFFARLKRGMSPFKGSRDHFALRLMARGYSAQKIALFACGLGLLGAGVGIAAMLVSQNIATILFMGLFLFSAIIFLWLWRMPTPP